MADRSVSGIMTGIVALAVGGFLFAYLVPPAISAIFTANVVGWDSATTALRAIIPIVVMISGIILFLRGAGIRIG